MYSQIYCIKVITSHLFKALFSIVCGPVAHKDSSFFFFWCDLEHLGTPNWLIIILLSPDALLILRACGAQYSSEVQSFDHSPSFAKMPSLIIPL